MVWINPFDEMRRMQQEIDRMFNNLFAQPSVTTSLTPVESGWREPLTDMWEDDDSIIVTAELPGVDKDEIKLNITENALELKVEKKREKKSESGKSRRIERTYSGFYRYIELPSEIIPEKAKATYKNGVLEVRIPKSEKSKKKSVEVKVE